MYLYKRVSAAFLTIIMLVAIMPATALATTPEAYILPEGVTAETWEYRELVPDSECETSAGFINRGSDRTGTEGNFSVVPDGYYGSGLYRKSSHYRGIAFNAMNMEVTSEQAYRMSAMIKTDFLGESSKARIGVFENWGTGEGYVESKKNLSTLIEITEDNVWTLYDTKVRIGGVKADGSVQIGIANLAESADYGMTATATNGSTTYIQDLYIDDWSMRKIPGEDLPSSKVMSVVAGTEENDMTDENVSVILQDGDVVKFAFSLDIDPRSVRKEKITVNGIPDSNVISSATVEMPNGSNRKTVLSLNLNNLKNGNKYTISMPELKDAWGREVEGKTTISFITKPILEEKISFEKNGTDIASFEQGDLTAKIELKSNEEQQVTVVVAAIANGTIAKISHTSLSLADGEEKSGENAVLIPINSENAEYMRVFIWTNSDFPTPIVPYTTFGKDGLIKSEY
ncbi:MAG: hypothetical protein IKW59_06835 [Clostridia bacterium]|nr:hypothetical protein [Clostridia bacterium]